MAIEISVSNLWLPCIFEHNRQPMCKVLSKTKFVLLWASILTVNCQTWKCPEHQCLSDNWQDAVSLYMFWMVLCSTTSLWYLRILFWLERRESRCCSPYFPVKCKSFKRSALDRNKMPTGNLIQSSELSGSKNHKQ